MHQYAVIGYPLDYSLSPELHNYFFKEFKITARYFAMPMQEKEVKDLFTKKELTGFNVTIPHKELAFSLCDELTLEAQAIGAVNTVILKNNSYLGHNTDADGFLMMLYEDLKITPENLNVLLIGAGGAGKAITFSLLKSKCASLKIIEQSPLKAFELKDHYKDNRIEIVKNTEEFDFSTFDLVINATPVGMGKLQFNSPLSKEQISLLPKKCLVCDIIYSPPETLLMKYAKEFHLKTTNGLGMLAGQGILAEKFWFSENLRYNIAKDILLRNGKPSLSFK